VDLLITNGKKQILLGERLHEPFFNQWAMPGGRVFFGETIEAAISRILTNELNFLESVDKQKLIGYVDFVNEVPIANRHSVSMVFQIDCSDITAFSSTESFSRIAFFNYEELKNVIVMNNHASFIDNYFNFVNTIYG